MWVDIQQNTDEWLDLRAGKVTGSSIAKVMANFGKAFGDPAKKLAVDIAVEQLTGSRGEDFNYTNTHMERGHEEEPIARMLYEREHFVDVTNGGFFDNGDTGSSPDGLVNTDGVIEIKSHIKSAHYAVIKRGSFEPTYRWQLAFNLNESGRNWTDYISFCSAFPANKRLYVFRIWKHDFAKELQMMEERLCEFFDLVETIKKDIEAY